MEEAGIACLPAMQASIISLYLHSPPMTVSLPIKQAGA